MAKSMGFVYDPANRLRSAWTWNVDGVAGRCLVDVQSGDELITVDPDFGISIGLSGPMVIEKIDLLALVPEDKRTHTIIRCPTRAGRVFFLTPSLNMRSLPKDALLNSHDEDELEGFVERIQTKDVEVTMDQIPL